MTPQPPSSSDGSGLPPRHRPNMGNLSKDNTESDLWAFDDLESSEPADDLPRPKTAEPTIPVPREMKKKDTLRREEPASPEEAEQPVAKVGISKESIKVNVSKARPKVSTPSVTTGHSDAGSDFDDLDSWEETEPATADEVVQKADPVEPEKISAPAEIEGESAVVEASPLDSPEETFPESSSGNIKNVQDEIATAPVPSGATETPLPAKRPGLGLSQIEKLGLVALLALLVVGGGIVYFYTISRLPKGADVVKSTDFPIKGTHLSVTSATTYWRAPITSGENADTFRRDTQLLPVISLAVEGGPANLRVFFRNERGDLVGDSVTRPVSSGSKHQFAATAGFDDLGMFAAYRTGQSKPWTVEVFEAAAGESQGKEFKKVFEMNMSPENR